MDSSELNENVCRICLDYNVMLNWNAEICKSYGMSFKDCYFKYMKLSECDSENYPTDLCEMCANELRNAHMLFEKALESLSILRDALKVNKINPEYSDAEVSNGRPKMLCDVYASDHESVEATVNNIPIWEKALIDVEDKKCLTHLYNNQKIVKRANAIRNEEETSVRYFIDIQSLGLSTDISLQQLTVENDDTELPKSSHAKITINNREQLDTLPVQQVDQSCDSLLTKSTVANNGVPKRKFYESSSGTLLNQNTDEFCDAESPVRSINKRSKPRDKMCQYCSRKFNGTNHLKAHEATHCENRERNETCPQCGIKLYTKVALREHMKIHKENRQKNHKCEFCEKAFFNKGALNVHRRIHLGLMVKCQICSKEYYRQVDLNKHLQSHSAYPLQKNVEKFKYTIQCQYCDKSIWTNKWKAHKARHLNEPQMKCKICDKIFFSRENCTNHLKKTHGKREYDKYIYYYVDSYSRMSHLMMTQQESVKTLQTKV